jgi:hypothetical protein
MVVKGDPAPDADPSLRPGFPSVEINAFILQGPPQTLNEDVVDAASFAAHRDPAADPFQQVGPGEGRELRPLIGVHDLRRAELLDRLVQRLDAEVSLQGVRYPLGQYLSGEPVHDGDQIEEAAAHGQVGDVGAPNLIGPFHAQPAK